MAPYIRVRVLDVPYPVDRPYDYYVPVEWEASVDVGSLLYVPFGGGNRRHLALVTERIDAPAEAKTCKTVVSRPIGDALRRDLVELCLFLASHTLCTVGEAVHAVIPPNLLTELGEYYTATEKTDGTCPEGLPSEIADYLRREGRTSLEKLTERFGRGTVGAVGVLCDAGYVTRTCELPPPSNIRYEKRLSLARPITEIADVLCDRSTSVRLRSDAHRRILTALSSGGDALWSTILKDCDVTAAQVNALVKKGLVKIEEFESIRNPYADAGRARDTSPIVLSRAQGAAFDALTSSYEEENATAALLYGVTGSGKTKVIMKLLDRVLADGKTAIVMVPEIALTPQTVSLFCSRYGERVAVFHSSLSAGERFDAWRRVASGEVDLVIGTRSAVFAPLRNIGLIVIDEEHEHTYKSDSNPKYHARDVAAYRVGKERGMMLLASATPSLESFYRAKRGQYRLVELRERFGGARLPTVEVVDLREELRLGRRSPIGRRLLDALKECKEDAKQAILFINRRGYSSTLSCADCGSPITCPNCSVSLTYHTAGDGGYLLCHCCGYRAPVPRTCPSCDSSHIRYLGFGTQKVESELSLYLPESRVLRMDADTTGTKFAHGRLIGKFRSGEYDILLGTQMVAKGHDFPAVTLVGVLLADASLHVCDFRAAERTFALLTQVIGRAGRASDSGTAIIQTYTPESEVIRLACAQDYDAFYESEIAVRKSLTFPPFCDMAQFTLTSADEGEALRAASAFASSLTELAKSDYADLPLVVFGPFEAQQYKAAGKYRVRLVVKCRLSPRTREMFHRLLCHFGERGGHRVTLACDLNPSDV